MKKINSKTFYKRHSNELEKYIFDDKKTLHISSNKNDFIDVSSNYDFYFYEFSKDITQLDKKLKNNYDLIIITDIIENIEDITNVFSLFYGCLNNNGKLLVTSINNAWYPIIGILEFLKLKNYSRKSVYTNLKNINNIISQNKFKFVNYNTRQFIPFKLVSIGTILNNIFEILLSKTNLGIKSYILLQKKSLNKESYSKTIIIPAKNEEKNIPELVNRIPKFTNCQLIFACGDSQDKTLEEAIKIQNDYTDFKVDVFQQSGKGKANAVFEAFEKCTNDIVAILDADQSVDPETLTNFFELIEDGEADFVNGTRFVYRKEKNAMRFFNVLGNKMFQFLISVVISKKLSDSLCGTKVFHSSMIPKILDWQNLNIVKDPFGDFDLLFSASYFGQNIQEYPIHYRSRVYGSTQISRFKDGYKLFLYFINALVKFNISNNNT